VAPGHSAYEVFAEALIAQDRGDVSVATYDVGTERREMDRVGRAQSMIKRVRIGDKFW
jgi:hypothetical protein